MNKKIMRLTGDDYLKAQGGDRHACVPRAMAEAFGVEYWKAHKYCAKRGRKNGHGTFTHIVLGVRPHTLFGSRMSYTALKKKQTVRTFVKRHPKGRYICHVRKHAFAVVDGKVFGQSSGNFGMHIDHYWRISKKQNHEREINKGTESRTQEGTATGAQGVGRPDS